jgi:N6-adenosine-specific RNA methylase IME4
VSGKYKTIVADPPWKYTMETPPTAKGGGPSSAERNYGTMTTAEIAALPVAEMAADNAHLYMWVTNPVLTEQRLWGGFNACAIARAWGFEPKTMLTWIKSEKGAGMGFFFRGDTEHVLFAVRGTLPIPAEQRISNVFRGPRGRHSQKPDAFLDLVERVSPGPYVELFARRARFNWDYWGNESLSTAEMPEVAA